MASTTSAPVAKRGVTRTVAGVAVDGAGVATAGPREQAANSRAASVAAATRKDEWLMLLTFCLSTAGATARVTRGIQIPRAGGTSAFGLSL